MPLAARLNDEERGLVVISVATALFTFGCTFGSALLGTFIRSKLPKAHLEKDSQDVVRLGMGLVATMTALLLGLVTAAAKGSFDSQDAAVRTTATNLLTLDRHLARYGPEAQPIRDELRGLVSARVEATWGHGEGATIATGSIAPGEAIQNEILALSPQSDAQRWFKNQALGISEDVLKMRKGMMERGGSVSPAFLVVVISWLTMTFLSFGLSAPRNVTVLTALGVASLSVAAAILLILELDTPYSGMIMVSSSPLRFILTSMAH